MTCHDALRPAAAALIVGLVAAHGAPAAAQTTELVSKDSGGIPGNSHNGTTFVDRAISADGRIVTFTSFASNLVVDDTNGMWDIFVHDRGNGTTTRVSVASDGTQANSESFGPSISADGQVITFQSFASNLVAGDTNGTSDVFVHDRGDGTTTRVSVASDGTQASSDSFNPSVSADGQVVTFTSFASNLVVDDTNGTWDIFVHDRGDGTTTRVSVASDETQASSWSAHTSVSADGQVVTFYSHASNLVAGDTNGTSDVFVHDRGDGTTTRVSVASDGTQASSDSFNPSVSADGQVVTFTSFASNLVVDDTNGMWDIFVHDRGDGTTTRISVANDGTQANHRSHTPSISADGQVITFQSLASDLVVDDTNGTLDIFVHDRGDGTTTRVSVASDGTQASSESWNPSISADGSVVAFASNATNLIPDGTNGFFQVYVHDRSVVENTAPVADAGADQTVACTDMAGTAVTLDGSASFDPDDDPITYGWTGPFGSASGGTPEVPLGLGASTVSLVVNDGELDSAPDTVDIMVYAQVEGLLTPLAALVREGSEPSLPDKAFKQKSTLSLKLHLYCGAQALTSTEVNAPWIAGLTVVGEAPLDLETMDADSGESNDGGYAFRYSDEGEWVYNLSTKGLSAGKVYEITIETPDHLRYAARFALK